MTRKFLFVLAMAALHQSVMAANADYGQLSKLVQDGKYAEALPGLETYVKSRWEQGTQEKAVVLYVETCMRLRKHSEARKAAQLFLDFFPQSVYRDRVETAFGMLEVLSGNAFNGAELLRRVQAYSDNPVAIQRSRETLANVFDAHLLGSDELASLLEKGFEDAQTRQAAFYELGNECRRDKRFKAARYWYEKAGALEGPLVVKAQTAAQELASEGSGKPIVLVLAPLTGDYADFGKAMLQGVLLAQDEFQGKGDYTLRVVDDRADASVALQRTKEALAQDSVIGVVGPIMSAPASAVAAWMGVAAPNVPMLTPTATDDGIAKMGSNIFQVNMSTARLARAIADYAMECLGIMEFGIMAPNTDYGTIMTQEFSRRVENRGGRILATQTFEEGRPDYKAEFNKLRDRKFNLDIKRRNMEKGNENLTAISAKERKMWQEENVVVFPGLFMPSSDPADAGLMAGQAAFYKLGGRLLGSSGWYGRDLIGNGKRLVEGAYFSVPFTDAGDNSDYQKFAKKFKDKWQAEPGKDKVSGLSYDAARILLGSWTQGSGDKLADRISTKSVFTGVYGDIKFRNGANYNTHVLSVENAQFVNRDQCPAK